MNLSINNMQSMVLLVLLFFVAFNTHAEMYKWVDEEGNTHYSQSPPPGDVEVQTIKPPPKVKSDTAAESQDDSEDKTDASGAEDKISAENQAALDKNAEINKRNCEIAKKNLVTVKDNPRVFSTDADGTRRRIGEDERQEKIAAAQKAIADYCN